MRTLASIQRIASITPIKDADRIELVHVLGWQCVAKKGEFQPGDSCVYFEVDSFLPMRPEFEFLHASSYCKSELLGEGYRLRTARMRGEISQGLAMPINAVLTPEQITSLTSLNGDIPIGTDVTDLLGVREWQIPEMASSGGTIIAQANSRIPITDETRIQSVPELLAEFAGLPYYITTKMDGTSCSISMGEDRILHVFGHNYEYATDEKCAFYQWVRKCGVEEKLKALLDARPDISEISIQGEFCGSGIQSNRMRLKEPNWFVFTVNENKKRTGLNELLFVSHALGVDTVPIEETGTDLPSVYPDEKALLARCEENRKHAYPGVPEGIVIRPVEPVVSKALRGGMLSMKVKSNRYLLKTGDD